MLNGLPKNIALGTKMSTTPRTNAARGFHDMDTAVFAEDMAQLETEFTEAEASFKEERQFLIAEIKEQMRELARLRDENKLLRTAQKISEDSDEAIVMEVISLRADRTYNHECINRLASATGTLGERSEKVVDIALSTIDRLREENKLLKAAQKISVERDEQLIQEARSLQSLGAILAAYDVAVKTRNHLKTELEAMTARVEKAEDELKQMQSSALTWARFAGDKAACADIAEQRARLTERLWKEFITLMEITEESDSGYEFNPNKISSCRAIDGKRLNEILVEARRIVF